MTVTLKPFRDRIIPWYFVMFFLVVAAVNAVMVTLAVRTLPGTVTDHPYEKGLAYNQVVAASDKQEALGWKGDKPLQPESVTAKLFRPSKAAMDFVVSLTRGGAPVKFPVNGLWEVQIDAVVGDTHYKQTKRIVVE